MRDDYERGTGRLEISHRMRRLFGAIGESLILRIIEIKIGYVSQLVY